MNSNKLGIPKEMLATKVIPFLVPLSIENGLSLLQVSFENPDPFKFIHSLSIVLFHSIQR